MGFDLYAASDFLESRGICEMQLNNLIDNIQNPQYVNVLKPVPTINQTVAANLANGMMP